MSINGSVEESTGESNARVSGIIIAVGSVLTVVLMACHPRPHAHDVAEFVADLAAESGYNGFIHGGLILAIGVVLLGLTGFAARLGMTRPLVRAGLLAYGAGWLATVGAALINGFILPGVVARRSPSGTDAEFIEKIRPLLAFCQETNAVLARAGLVAICIAVLCWSAELLLRPKPARAVGWTGVVCAILPLIALGLGRLPMTVHGFGAFVLLQGIWYFSVAAALIRGRV